MTGFDLRALVKTVCDSSSLTNDDELTKEVLSKIAPGEERAALEQSLPSYVRRFVSRDHRPLSAPQSAPTGQEDGDAHRTSAGGGAVPFRSRKIRSIRSAWQQWEDQLNARVNVAHKERKFWGDCTLADLAFVAQHRRELSSSNLSVADYADSVAGLMREFAVETVRDLPEVAVKRLGRAA